MKTKIWVYAEGSHRIGSFYVSNTATVDEIIRTTNEKFGADHWDHFRIDSDH